MPTNKNTETSKTDFSFALPIGSVLKNGDNEYRVVEVLGEGGFGITYKVSSVVMVHNVPQFLYFAVKEHFMKGCDRGDDGKVVYTRAMKKDVEETRKDFIAEAKRLNKLSGLSHNIVRVNEVFEENNTAYYVMQFLDGGELTKHLKKDGPMTEAKALSIITPIAKAVSLIHNERLLHLDIKPDNIVLMTSPTDGTQYPVLIDFGIAKHFNANGKPTSTHSAKGASNGYAPIEQYSSIDQFAPEIDVYALGATLFTLLTGRIPKKSFDITEQDIVDALPEHVSRRTRNAIKAAMAKLKQDRTPTVEAFLKSLEAEYTLPIGTVLRSPDFTYRITGIRAETDTILLYNAVVAANNDTEATTVPGENKYGVDDNKTRVIKAKPSDNQTLHRSEFRVYELYVRNRFKRNEDGGVDGCTQKDKRAFDQLKSRTIPKDAIGKKNEDGLPLAEKFDANGTQYFACLVVKQPSIFMRLKKFIQGISLKPVLYGLLTLLVIAAVFFAIQTLRQCETRKAEEVSTVDILQSEEDSIQTDVMPEDSTVTKSTETEQTEKVTTPVAPTPTSSTTDNSTAVTAAPTPTKVESPKTSKEQPKETKTNTSNNKPSSSKPVTTTSTSSKPSVPSSPSTSTTTSTPAPSTSSVNNKQNKAAEIDADWKEPSSKKSKAAEIDADW